MSELGEALVWSGRTDDALRRADGLAERASVAGDRVGELCGRILAEGCRVELEPESTAETMSTLVEHALPVFLAGDDLALYIAYSAVSEFLAFMLLQMRLQA